MLKAWFQLMRPWSLTATFVPFFFALAVRFTRFPPDGWYGWGGRLYLAFASAALLQIACNLLNTYGDDKSGVDAVEGAYVSTPQIRDGLVRRSSVLKAAIAALVLGGALSVPLFIYEFGWEIRFNALAFAVGFVGFIGAVNYATLFRFKYRGLGVPFVFLLMGGIECAGFLFAGMPRICADFCWIWSISSACRAILWLVLLLVVIFVTTLPISCQVAAILHGNDMRDIHSDAAAGIKTMATRLGPEKALHLFRMLHILPYVFAGTLFLANSGYRIAMYGAPGYASLMQLLPFLAWPLTSAAIASAKRAYEASPEHPMWFGLERKSGAVHLVFGILWSISVAACS